MHQRYFEASTSVGAPNVIKLVTPASEAELPRGIYMMFLVTNHPSISHAEWVVFL